jgi:hypothetical protein
MSTQAQPLEELMEQKDPTVLGQMLSSVDDTHIPGTAAMAQRALQRRGKICLHVNPMKSRVIAQNPNSCVALRGAALDGL